jgi:hypothetical protein
VDNFDVGMGDEGCVFEEKVFFIFEVFLRFLVYFIIRVLKDFLYNFIVFAVGLISSR